MVKETPNFRGGMAIPLTFEAIYENGVLKPIAPLPLKEHEKVLITVQPAESWIEASYGIIGWKGDLEELRRLALAPELELEEDA
jgi:predicted DNA-binding antitoxin AbrB/MazE fold protein